jgi:glycosyltransferase involved in cell wall biosynthesis
MVLATKGVVELVDACSRIAARDFELEMIGPVGPEMQEQLKAIASKRADGRWLRFTGALSNDQAVERITEADIFVLPSYTEGFPISVLEAMASGLAIVGTSVGAIPEMLVGNDGEAAGVIVPPRETESLRLALEDLLKNPGKRLELGASARRKCETSYRMPDLARRLSCDIWFIQGRRRVI